MCDYTPTDESSTIKLPLTAGECELQNYPSPVYTEKPNKMCLAVEGKSLRFEYGKLVVLKDANISVERGVIYGLLGPSGCGKTTFLRCIVGRHRPSSGTIRVYGKLPGQTGFCVPGPGVGFMPQELSLHPELTTEETLMYFGRIYQMSPKAIKERVSFLTDFLDIPDKKKLVKNLSGGQQRRVSFAAALIHKPPLVILDEPTVGVDPLLRKSIWNYLQKLAKVDFLTIIITTHYVEEARQANIVGLMRDGRLLAEANPETLIREHNASSLEDVFLKLAIRDTYSQQVQPQENHTAFTETEVVSNTNLESHDDVWIQQKQRRPNNRSPVSKNGSDHKVEDSLLSVSTDPESVLNPGWNYFSAIQMSSVRLGALTTKNFIRLKRNIPLVIFQLFLPAFQVILFCLCIGGEPFDLPLAIVNLESDPSGKSNYFLEQINSRTIRQVPFSNLTTAIESVENGKSWGVLHIGPTFTDSLINRFLEGLWVDNKTIEDSTVTLHLDMTNKQISITLLTKIMDAFQVFLQHFLKNFYQNPVLAEPPLKLGKPIYGHNEPDLTDFMIPGIMVGITYIMAVGLSGLSILIEKKEGLLDRSCISGVQTWEIVCSIFAVMMFLLVFQVALVLLCTFLVFNISCVGSIIWVVIALFLVGLEGMAYGLLISAISKDESMIVMLALGSFFPSLLLSGIIWPVEAMPYYLMQISYFLPLTAITNTVRCVVSRGWSITEHGIWDGYVSATVWIIPVVLISTMIFKYKK